MQRNIFLSIILAVTSNAVFAKSPLEDRIDKATAMGLFQVLEGAKIIPFSKDYLIKDGIQDKDLKNWDDVTLYANTLAAKQYSKDLKLISQVYRFLKDAVNALHSAYSTLGFSRVGKKLIVNSGKKTFSQQELNEIKKVIDLSAKYQNDVRAIYKKMIRPVAPSKNWTKKFYKRENDIKDADAVWPGYVKMLDKLTSNFQSEIGDASKAKDILNKLDAVEYIMKEKLKKKEDDARRKNHTKVLNLIEKIRRQFPEIVSDLDLDKLRSLDKISIIVFAQAGTYESVLGALNREAQAIYDSAYKK